MKLRHVCCLAAWLLTVAGAVAVGFETSSQREVFWGTPNFGYGEKHFPPEKLREFGVSYVSHLIYWNNYETAPDRWDESFLSRQVAFVDSLRAQGILSGIRLGEAHPGARLWKVENGRPYSGRSTAYPGNADTDERYFRYLSRVVQAFRGKVDHYVLGDELDMIYGASYRDESRLREYFDFLKKASAIIRKEDPQAKVVVFPFAWGEVPRNAAIMQRWGLASIADGFCFNISHGDCETPAYLTTVRDQLLNLFPDFKLYSNGFGYLSDLLPESTQAARLAHTMLTIWECGWHSAPYYTLADSENPWSSGLYRENLQDGGIKPRQAAGTFTRLAELLKRKPRLNPAHIRILSYQTPHGEVTPAEYPSAGLRALWQDDGDESFGIITSERMSDARILQVKLEIPAGGEGRELHVEDVTTGTTRPATWTNEANGKAVTTLDAGDAVLVLRWK